MGKNHRKHRCDVCKAIYASSSHLQKHVVIHPEFQCDTCEKIFSKLHILKRHKVVHSGNRIECDVCNKTFSPENIKRHAQIHSGTKPFHCDICEKAFIRKDDLRRHMVVHSDLTQHQCGVCKKTFTRAYNLEQHKKYKHSGLKPHTCEECGISFARRNNLNRHMVRHTGIKLYDCAVCTKSFSRVCTLKLHMTTHDDIESYTHADVNSDEKRLIDFELYKCDICKKSFVNLALLKSHMALHTGLREYRCDVCEKSFRSDKSLFEHKLIHFSPHKCDLCKKSFRSARDAKDHQIIHSGDKPFKCDVCNKSFRSANYVKQHQKIHSDVKPHVCEVCDQGFVYIKSLRHHMKTHVDFNPYICDLCGKDFPSNKTLANHQCSLTRIRTAKAENTVPNNKITVKNEIVSNKHIVAVLNHTKSLTSNVKLEIDGTCGYISFGADLEKDSEFSPVRIGDLKGDPGNYNNHSPNNDICNDPCTGTSNISYAHTQFNSFVTTCSIDGSANVFPVKIERVNDHLKSDITVINTSNDAFNDDPGGAANSRVSSPLQTYDTQDASDYHVKIESLKSDLKCGVKLEQSYDVACDFHQSEGANEETTGSSYEKTSSNVDVQIKQEVTDLNNNTFDIEMNIDGVKSEATYFNPVIYKSY